MSTRSYIGVVQDDGRIEAVYCHSDGQPNGVGASLLCAHQTPQRAKKLIALGSLSGIEGAEVVAYVRDKGEHMDSSNISRVYATVERLVADAIDMSAEYVYVFGLDRSRRRWKLVWSANENVMLQDAFNMVAET